MRHPHPREARKLLYSHGDVEIVAVVKRLSQKPRHNVYTVQLLFSDYNPFREDSLNIALKPIGQFPLLADRMRPFMDQLMAKATPLMSRQLERAA